MRREWRWAVGIIAALAIGATRAQSYAHLAAPYYEAAARLIAEFHPWKIVSVDVVGDKDTPGAVVRLTGEVRRLRTDPEPAALVYPYVHVGAAIETPLVFWTLLILWPMPSGRRRVALLALAVPVFLAVTVLTTVCQLLGPLAWASAVLDGINDPVTVWDRWSRFLESGGRFVVELSAALVAVALASVGSRQRGPSALAQTPSA